MEFTCCISMSKGSNNEPIHQQTYSVPPSKVSRDASPPPAPRCGTPQRRADATIISTTASALEDAVCSHLEYRDNAADVGRGEDPAGEEGADDPVRIYENDDAYLLRCRPVLSENGEEPAPTIFGIAESAASLGRRASSDREVYDGGIPVRVTILDPRCDREFCDGGGGERERESKGCCCRHPRGNWTRTKIASNGENAPYHPNHEVNGGTPISISSHHAHVKIVDLTKIQDSRRSVGPDELYPCFDTPGKVFHLLRSVLNCSQDSVHHSRGLHSASPWNQMYYCDNKETGNNYLPNGEDCAADQVVALLVKDLIGQRENEENGGSGRFWDDIERREVNELLNFRTGDAAPSYFLHSSSQLSGTREFLFDLITNSTGATFFDREETLDGGCSLSSALLLVYRHLPPRDVLSRDRLAHAGCLIETYFEHAETTEMDAGSEPTQTQPIVKHRMVSPPYQDHRSEYPGLLGSLLAGITSIREEAQKIPQWTAWPEQSHYSDASWNVFPLCYTFPATDLTQRKWIQKTCSFVPETTKLLRTLGPALRTALFSRLDPRARLGTHTGWSDLANHVLRVHIPLVVPGGNHSGGKEGNYDDFNAGLCGTWVDGCVETHEEGRVVSFDDSKVHRAFNYSDEERIVLIVDLLRPRELPIGTATGGHSDELDAFINGF